MGMIETRTGAGICSAVNGMFIPQGKVEGSAVTYGAFTPDPAAMTLDDTLYCGQADPCTGEIVRFVQTLERFEEIGCHVHIKTGTIIAHKKDPFAFILENPEFYYGLGKLFRIFPGIAQQVFQS